MAINLNQTSSSPSQVIMDDDEGVAFVIIPAVVKEQVSSVFTTASVAFWQSSFIGGEGGVVTQIVNGKSKTVLYEIPEIRTKYELPAISPYNVFTKEFL